MKKYIKLFEAHTTDSRLNAILDKISKSGIDSLSNIEKEFLNAHQGGKADKMNNTLNKVASDISGDKVFNDDTYGYKFIVDDITDEGVYFCINGKMTLPSIVLDGGKKISGELIGSIKINRENGRTDILFGRDGYTAYDFVQGDEYEFESFINVIIDSLFGDDDEL